MPESTLRSPLSALDEPERSTSESPQPAPASPNPVPTAFSGPRRAVLIAAHATAIVLMAVATEAAQLPALVGLLGGALILLHLLSLPGFGSRLQTIIALVPLILA